MDFVYRIKVDNFVVEVCAFIGLRVWRVLLFPIEKDATGARLSDG